jgi:hypothetical protein
LNSQIDNGNIDQELTWMLPYYYQIADWYIPKKAQAGAIVAASIDGFNLFETHLKKSDFIGRGQLGEYWRSIQL